MKTYCKNLIGQPQLLLKQSVDRRRELQQLVNAIGKRIEVQQTYCKGLEGIARSVERFVSEQKQRNVSGQTFSSFQLSHFNRAYQIKGFISSMKGEVFDVLKEELNNEQNEFKMIERDLKKIERQISTVVYDLNKNATKYINTSDSYEQIFIQNEILQYTSDFNKEKKHKLRLRSKELFHELIQYRSAYTYSKKDYNAIINRYSNQLEKHIETLQNHELKRLSLQIDTIMKTLIFQTSMIKNFEYDINCLSQHMEKKRPIDDILQFIEDNQKPPFNCNLVPANLLRESIYQMVKLRFHDRIEFEKSNHIKMFLENKGKDQKQNLENLKEYREQYAFYSQFIKACWQGTLNVSDIPKFQEYIQDQNKRHLALLFLQQYKLNGNLEITAVGFQNCTQAIEELLLKCNQKEDVFVSRKLIDLAFTYYTIIEQKTEKKLLYEKIMGANIFMNEQYWQACILESIQEDFYLISKKQILPEQWSIRMKSVIVGHLAEYSHKIIMLSMPTGKVREIIGRYCRLYQLTEDQNKDLAKCISVASKKYKQKYPNLVKVQE